MITFLHVPEASQKYTWGDLSTYSRSHVDGGIFSGSKNGRFYIRGKSTNDKLDPYYAVITKKAKDPEGGEEYSL